MNDIIINIEQQILLLGDIRYAVSTALKGCGEVNGSYQTPRGRHIIYAKIGAASPKNTVFVSRQPTREIYNESLAKTSPRNDWILTRILWLAGCEENKNKGGDVDTLQRYIYIHGTPDSTVIGKPGSIGCIRMYNDDVIDLFERVKVGTFVEIVER